MYNGKNYVGRGLLLGEIVAVLSGKGGTGKTSTCSGIATALASQGSRVLCIDCDVGLRNLDISLGMSESAALSFLDVSSGAYPVELAPRHPLYPSLSFLTAPMNFPIEKIDAEDFAAFLRRLRGQFDYILLDAPAGVDAGFRLVTAAADRCIVVTGPGPAAIRDAARVGELLELAGKKSPRLIVNRVSKSMLSALRMTVDDVMDTAGLPLIGVVLEDPSVTLAAAFGRSVHDYSPKSEAAKCFRRIAKRLQGIPEPIRLR